MRFLSFSFLILTILVGFSGTAHAYTEKSTGAPFIVSLTPANPGPNQTIQAKLTSYTFDPNSSNIQWLVNGTKQTTSNPTVLTFRTGSVGSVTILKITSDTGSQKSEKVITIRPASVDLIWETNSHTPAWYLGKAMPTSGNTINIVSFPNFVGSNGKRIDPSQLIYKWEKDSYNLSANSGLGKATFSLPAGKNNSSSRFKVSVSDVSSTMLAEKTITITTTQPKVILFENDPLLGLLSNRALTGSVTMKSDELSITAEPFFITSNPFYAWQVGGKELDPEVDYNNTVTLRKPEKGSGEVNLLVQLKNRLSSTTLATKNLLVDFSQR